MEWNAKVPLAYMDEEFHLRQTAAYCVGNYEYWDPKLTTFPGLYIISSVIYRSIGSVSSYCSSVTSLRLISMIFSYGNLILIMRLRARETTNEAFKWQAIGIWLVPIHFFCSFMYYTDTSSTFFVLLSVLLMQSGRIHTSALAGATAVLFRQTNIVWVLFVVGTALVNDFESLRGRNNDHNNSTVYYNFIKYLVLNCKNIIGTYWSHLCIIAAFIIFVFKNDGSIVLGDKANHIPSVHLAQLLYFSVFAATFIGVEMLSPSNLWLFITTMRFVDFILAIISSAIVVKYFSIVHPFLLADNRHYVFYIWKNVFLRHPWTSFAVIPIYIYAIWSLYKAMRTVRSSLWISIYVIAVACVLIPTPLVELRYFIVPFIILHVNTKQKTVTQSMLSIVIYSLVNIVTIFVFLYRPFLDAKGNVARFMW